MSTVPWQRCAISPAFVSTVRMQEQSGSGERGAAILTQQKDGVNVAVKLSGAPSSAEQPMHIQQGSCASIDPESKYRLASAVNGVSTTLVKGVTLAALLASPYAINIHKSTNDLGTYVSCGDIKRAVGTVR